MKIPDWLSEELAGTGWIFRTTMSAGLCMTAGTVLWTTFTGETALEVAYPLFAFVSSGLLGVGLIRTGGVNVPAALGTLVALIGASIWLTAAVKGDLEPGSWERPVMTLYFVGLVAVAMVMGVCARVPMALQRRDIKTLPGFCWGVLSLIGMFGVPGIYVMGLLMLIG